MQTRLIIAAVLIAGIIGAVMLAKSNDEMAMHAPSHEPGMADSSSSVPVGKNEVAISDFEYGPKDLTVKVGDTVTWTNRDQTAHTVTSKDGGPLDSEYLDKGKTFSYTFKQPGTFEYFCEPHPYMKAKVTVTS